MRTLSPALLLVSTVVATAAPLVSLDEAVASRRDAWGEAAMAQPNGPSYEFFEPLLPPPRYVHADFRYYPIVLSAPNAKVKARLISNGSGVNLSGGSRSWHDIGVPFTFRVGPDETLFGMFPSRLQEPTLAEGWLPIPEIRYLHMSPYQSEGAVPLTHVLAERTPEIYRLEAFVSTDPALAENAVVFVKFTLAQGTGGIVTITVDDNTPLTFSGGRLVSDKGDVVAYADATWKWERKRLQARVTADNAVTLAIPTRPLPQSATPNLGYDDQRRICAETWRQILAGGMQVETPEPRVNHAWRHLLVQNFELISGDRIFYSAANQYEQLYEAEGSDAALAMMAWGFEGEMRRLVVPLLDFTRKGLEYHQASFKLTNICRYYWQTRDAESVRALRPRWEKEARRFMEGRTGPHGLLPPERYAGDISTPAVTVNANAKGAMALRDLGAVLAAIGEMADAARYGEAAREFRKSALAAIEKNARRETTPPFVPGALFSDEPTHDPIIRGRIGSYWNIVIGYTIGCGIFPPGSEEESWIPRYQEQHGGLFMGMIRSGGGGAFNFWPGSDRVNPLYGTRYALDTLRRDDPERALVSFYGMLAQGFTRNTFVCGEGCTLTPVDDRGRMFYCPPNSAANGHFLSMLRNVLVQDWDLSDDGKPETLRLLFATPRRWLEDGKTIKVERAPTTFGVVSVSVQSHLSRGEVLADVTLPGREIPARTQLRIRVPDGWRIRGAEAGGRKLEVDPAGTVDLTSLRGRVMLRFEVSRG